jgi:hypothetical protein
VQAAEVKVAAADAAPGSVRRAAQAGLADRAAGSPLELEDDAGPRAFAALASVAIEAIAQSPQPASCAGSYASVPNSPPPGPGALSAGRAADPCGVLAASRLLADTTAGRAVGPGLLHASYDRPPIGSSPSPSPQLITGPSRPASPAPPSASCRAASRPGRAVVASKTPTCAANDDCEEDRASPGRPENWSRQGEALRRDEALALFESCFGHCRERCFALAGDAERGGLRVDQVLSLLALPAARKTDSERAASKVLLGTERPKRGVELVAPAPGRRPRKAPAVRWTGRPAPHSFNARVPPPRRSVVAKAPMQF